MADRRVRPPKDKEQLVSKLNKNDDPRYGVFATRAHLLTFAAVYGFTKGRNVPVTEGMEGIRQEIFERHGFDTIINLLALAATRDAKCLAQNDEADESRVSIFEAYANGGLELLRAELQGIDDPLQHLLLLLQQERSGDTPSGEFDLTKFM